MKNNISVITESILQSWIEAAIQSHARIIYPGLIRCYFDIRSGVWDADNHQAILRYWLWARRRRKLRMRRISKEIPA